MGPTYSNYIQQLQVLPGATGTPLTPIVPSNTWSSSYPLAPYTTGLVSNGLPLSPVGFVPTIIDVNFR